MRLIHFNTSRLYQSHGQRITLIIPEDGTVYFNDHSRGVWGQFRSKPRAEANEREIIEWAMTEYDHNRHDLTKETYAILRPIEWDPSKERLMKL